MAFMSAADYGRPEQAKVFRSSIDRLLTTLFAMPRFKVSIIANRSCPGHMMTKSLNLPKCLRCHWSACSGTEGATLRWPCLIPLWSALGCSR